MKTGMLFIAYDNGKTKQYSDEWKESIKEFKDTAHKLRKIASILKTKDWYMGIRDINQPYIPHSFIMDSRYNILYQMYLDLKKEQIQVELDPEFSYTWKRSSYLYEMWCYFTLCHILNEDYMINTAEWNFIFSDKVLFPFLEEGTKVEMENDELRLKIIFDKPLPIVKTGTSLENPLYIVKHHGNIRTHNRPDILIHVYDKQNGWYLGSLILECKYRKLASFWNNNSERSSRGQLETYYNNARSAYLYGGIGEILKSNPVRKVFALTPDSYGEGQEQRDFSILVKNFKPSDEPEVYLSIKRDIQIEINEIKEIGQKLKGIQF